MMFILPLKLTDQGIRGIKDAPKRAQVARDLTKKVGCVYRKPKPERSGDEVRQAVRVI